jgi:hypothetical protein
MNKFINVKSSEKNGFYVSSLVNLCLCQIILFSPIAIVFYRINPWPLHGSVLLILGVCCTWYYIKNLFPQPCCWDCPSLMLHKNSNTASACLFLPVPKTDLKENISVKNLRSSFK